MDEIIRRIAAISKQDKERIANLEAQLAEQEAIIDRLRAEAQAIARLLGIDNAR